MNIRANARPSGRAHKQLVVENIADDRPVSDELLAGFVMASCDENPSSLFGWSVIRYPDENAAVVTLNID